MRRHSFWAFFVWLSICLPGWSQSVWNGSGTNNDWTTVTNWVSGTAPINNGTDNVAFSGSNRLTPNVDVAWSIASLRFNAGAGAYMLSGQPLTLGSGGLTNASSSLQTLGNAIVLGAAQTWTASTSNLSLTGPVDTGGFLLTANSAASRTLSIAGVISGAGTVKKTGTGGLTLSGSNTFSGGVTLAAGTLTANHNNALGAGPLLLNGGTLTTTGTRTFANVVTVNGSTSLTGQPMTFSGAATTLAANATLTVTNTTTLTNGLVETGGARSLTKAGTGALIVLNAFSTTGNVAVNAGTLALGTGVSLPTSLLSFNGGVLATSGTFSRTLGAGPLQVNFVGTGGFAAYGGALTITGFAGTPVWGTTANFLTNAATLQFGSTVATDVVTWTNDFSLGAANRTISVNDNTTTALDKTVISGVVSGAGGMIKTGTGRLELTAANSFSGPVSLRQGEVAVNTLANGGFASSLGAGSGTDAAIRIGNTTSAATLRYTGTGHSTDRGILLAGTTGGAVLIADGSGPATFSGTVSASVAGTKTLTLSGTGVGEISGNLSNGAGTVAVSKTGTGTWRLSGSNSQTGNTTITAGTLQAGHNQAFGSGTLVLAGGTLTGESPLVLANTLSLTASSVIGGSAAITFDGNFSQTGSRILTINNSALTSFTGSSFSLAENNQARILTLAGTGNTLISSVVQNGLGTGADGLTKSGTGELTLTGSNTYTGTTTLSGGLLSVGSNSALGTGTLNVTSGTLRATGGNQSLANTVTLGGNLTVAGTSNLSLTGTSTLTGSRILTVNNTGTTTLSAVNLSNSVTNRTLTVTGTGETVISGVVANGGGSTSGALTKTGTGKLTLTGSNTYTGVTTLSGGLLSVGSNSALGTGTLNVTSGTLSATGGNQSLANTVTLGGDLTVAGTSNLSLTGTSTLTGSRTLTVNNTGTTTLSAVNLSNSATSRTLTVAGTGETVISGVVANGGGSTAGALTKTGTGRLILLGPNTYGGATTISAGTLEIRNGSGLGSTAGGTTVAAGATLALAGGITTAEGISISGTGMGNNGALRNLSGNNLITTKITQTGSSQIVSDAGLLTVDVANGDAVSGAFALTVGGSGDVAFNDRINNTSSGLTKTGSGSVTLAGNGNLLGATVVSGGRLVLLGSTTGGSLTVGSLGTLAGNGTVGGAATINGQHLLGSTPGTQTFTAGLAYDTGSTLQWELAGNTSSGPGTNFDQVLVTGGNLALASGTNLSLVFNGMGSSVNWNDAFWATGQSWTVVDYSGVGTSSGVFDILSLTTDSLGQSLSSARSGSSFSTSQIGNDVYLSYAVPEPTTGGLALVGAFLLFARRRRALAVA